MPTQEQILRLLIAGIGYEEAARLLGVPAGLAYRIATSFPVARSVTHDATGGRLTGRSDGDLPD
ncbi:hypothetical protein C3486_25050 [Streptomyces sp. Ru73]|uniref:hypothetical protein n=1 Tax=Streptomyces sp. Ru73 TaxID=2080748 RepID=UPI000CDD9ACA|nr:hypothetical protein [Streptomyces sp. Ru73]POX38057.1 hypothetical protein C3486_25050 [Streptomyces sp. Ru73]